ncbi:MAG: ClC family H(+)/Cl(-) exchange transporter [Treponema sp.]|jgi:H+/Cl- antiporter ClcA|nr:ClC family H(+)/Cl(-) exchange transporter [Treponema sp.]
MVKETVRGISPFVRRWYNSSLAVILESVFIGFVTGLVISAFRGLLDLLSGLRFRLYGFLPGYGWYWTALWILVLVLTGLFLGWAAATRPMIRGSGIPQVKGALLRLMTLDWKPELPLKFITGLAGIGAGLSLGREGPSIQIGAYVGKGVLTIFRRPNHERRILVTAASAAGVAAAFNAPLAGVLFVMEELRSSLSPLFISCSMGAAMAADVVAGYFFGTGPVFDFHHINVLPLRFLPWIALLGVLCAVLGDLFKRSIYLSLSLYDRFPIPRLMRPIVPLLISVPLSFFLYDSTGGGHELIESLSQGGHPRNFMLLLLIVKVLFTALCYGSGTSGGIFLPLLACGALSGAILGECLEWAGLAVEEQSLNFIILGMAAFFTGAVKAPVTGIVLILEMSGNFDHLGGLVLVCFSSFVMSELIASPPVYTVLLERMTGRAGANG